MKTRLGVMLSGGGTTLQNLADVIARGELEAEIVCVIASNPQAYGLVRAEKLGLPAAVISRKSFETAEYFSAAVADELRRHKVDLVCLAGYLSLWPIPPDFSGRVMNIHPALLPKFGGKGMHGRHVHEAVIAAGETESGCTVHFADNSYDTGPVIVQRRCPVTPADIADTLAARVFEQEKIAYPLAIAAWRQEVLQIEKGRAVLGKAVNYITQIRHGKKQLLVFDHVHSPEAGAQVPAGTLRIGEPPELAALREGEEESGLRGLKVVRKLGEEEFRSSHGFWHHRHFFELSYDGDSPETWDWHERDGEKLVKNHLFRLRWVDVDKAPPLAGGQGKHLPAVQS